MVQATLPKGQKKVLVRQCLNELGCDISYVKAKRWFMKNHKLPLASATFYHMRQDMQREAVKPPQPTVREKGHGITDLVKRAKELVDLIGKDEAITLIELLGKE